MKINRNNYEMFFIDYLEGNLSDEEILLLNKFLDENADLKQELDDFENIKVEPVDSPLINKEGFKKKESDLLRRNYKDNDELCIAGLEGDMTLEERAEFNRMMESDTEL